MGETGAKSGDIENRKGLIMVNNEKCYCDRRWLNRDDSPSTGSFVAYYGPTPWKEYKTMTFIEVSDCNNSIRLHMAETDTDEDFIEKLNKLSEGIVQFAEYLQNRKKSKADKVAKIVSTVKTVNKKEVKLKKLAQHFHIWSEGYIATGESGGAVYHGVAEGVDFIDACRNFAKNNPEFKSYYKEQVTYRGITPLYWGCRLFDNESDARKAFG